ncbi:hypothetical protein GUJ93_ZPchr0008g13498 [Zizania palustris]|uniref:non-specific serine/threonine protein kinase n=1 Tax=Zizania palustris TaxID=103762 RepID=A0A8J5QYX3_ZIZPA|nr:hypothetical protein GUJ93_ZPchr0008g13498 [Zizania palustris]
MSPEQLAAIDPKRAKRWRCVAGPELERGEFGVTYLCTEHATGEAFACKSISKKKLRTTVDIEDVRREVEIMRHLPRHPNIVTLRDTYENDNAVHLVMELCRITLVRFQRLVYFLHVYGSEPTQAFHHV